MGGLQPEEVTLLWWNIQTAVEWCGSTHDKYSRKVSLSKLVILLVRDPYTNVFETTWEAAVREGHHWGNATFFLYFFVHPKLIQIPPVIVPCCLITWK